MKPIEPWQLSSSAKQAFQLIEFDKDERLLYEVRKHWFGLYVIYAVGAFISLILILIAVGAALIGDGAALGAGINFSQLQLPVILLCFLTALLVVASTAIGAFLYKSNVILVTSDKLAQLLNVSLFNRKISQLSIGDIQDVSVVQKGVFAHLFKYGTIIVETAGEQQSYEFTFAPYPHEAAKMIITAHEENLKLHGN